MLFGIDRCDGFGQPRTDERPRATCSFLFRDISVPEVAARAGFVALRLLLKKGAAPKGSFWLATGPYSIVRAEGYSEGAVSGARRAAQDVARAMETESGNTAAVVVAASPGTGVLSLVAPDGAGEGSEQQWRTVLETPLRIVAGEQADFTEDGDIIDTRTVQYVDVDVSERVE